MKTFKIVFVLTLLLLTGINVYAENPSKNNLSISEQQSLDYYIHGKDYIYNLGGKRYIIMGDKPANVHVTWNIDQLNRVTEFTQFVVVTKGKALGPQTITAHITGDNIDIVLTKTVIAIDGDDPNINDSGYIPEWW